MRAAGRGRKGAHTASRLPPDGERAMIRRMRSIGRLLLAFSLTAAGRVVVILPQAEAHQDGCHRWHSCPSDSGSYTCGDLGYPCLYDNTPGRQAGGSGSSSSSGGWSGWIWLAVIGGGLGLWAFNSMRK